MIGKLASAAGYHLHLMVCHSRNGYFIGTMNETGPVSRESLEYFATKNDAQKALSDEVFTQRTHP